MAASFTPVFTERHIRMRKNAALLTAPLVAAILLGPAAVAAAPAAATGRPAMLRNCFVLNCVSGGREPALVTR